MKHLEKGRVVIFACGTGHPYFTTDTAAVLRATEIKADIILLGKTVDGVYDDDPAINPNAKKFEEISYMEVLERDLKVMDSTATAMCRAIISICNRRSRKHCKSCKRRKNRNNSKIIQVIKSNKTKI